MLQHTKLIECQKSWLVVQNSSRLSINFMDCPETFQTLSDNFLDSPTSLLLSVICLDYVVRKFLTLWKISKLQKKNFKLNGKINLEIRGHFVPAKNLLSWDKIGQFRKLTTQQSCHQLWWPTILSKQFLVKPIIKYLYLLTKVIFIHCNIITQETKKL